MSKLVKLWELLLISLWVLMTMHLLRSTITNTLTQYFSLAQFVSDLAREKKRKRKKQSKTKGNYIQPPSSPHAWSIEDLLYMAQMM